MEKAELLYEGKAKKVFAAKDKDLVIVSYKDDATAFDGTKKGTISGKGEVNNRMSNYLMRLLSQNGVPTHFVQELSARETLVKRESIVPLEAIVRNIPAGPFSRPTSSRTGGSPAWWWPMAGGRRVAACMRTTPTMRCSRYASRSRRRRPTSASTRPW